MKRMMKMKQHIEGETKGKEDDCQKGLGEGVRHGFMLLKRFYPL